MEFDGYGNPVNVDEYDGDMISVVANFTFNPDAINLKGASAVIEILRVLTK
jgi:hypothetical protein